MNLFELNKIQVQVTPIESEVKSNSSCLTYNICSGTIYISSRNMVEKETIIFIKSFQVLVKLSIVIVRCKSISKDGLVHILRLLYIQNRGGFGNDTIKQPFHTFLSNG